VQHEFLLLEQSVTHYFYVEVLQQHDHWQGKRFPHHNKAPSHTSPVVQQFLSEKNIPVIAQALYSLHLVLSDFWLFPTLKMGLKGTHFANRVDIKWNAMAKLQKILNKAFHWGKGAILNVKGKRCHMSYN
jgi:hypothetical protein